MVTAAQKMLVQDSFATIAPIADDAAASSWTATLEQHRRSAVTSIIVTMLEGAAVHTALAAERLAEPSSER